MKKKLLILLAMVFMLTACGQDNTNEAPATENSEAKTEENKETKVAKEDSEETKEETEEEKDEEFDGQILLGGSSTLAPVITAIAEEFSEEFVTWDKVDSSLNDKDIAIYVSSGGSGQGVKAVIDNTANFGLVSREVKDEEKSEMKDYQEFKMGVDALTLAVNPENPVVDVLDDLTTEQIVGLFSGEYKTWKDLDDSLPEEEVIVITRDINGGAHGVFQKAIMGDTEVKADAIQAASMGELVQNVIDNKFAIGYASFGLVNQNKDKLFTMKVNGIDASKENIIDGSYVIQRPLLIIKDGELNPAEQAFVDRVLGEEGQAIVEEMGFIPMN